MPDSVVNLLIQLPVVGIFCWFVLYKDKQMQEWLSEQRRADREVLTGLTNQVAKMEEALREHDTEVQMGLVELGKRGGRAGGKG